MNEILYQKFNSTTDMTYSLNLLNSKISEDKLRLFIKLLLNEIFYDSISYYIQIRSTDSGFMFYIFNDFESRKEEQYLFKSSKKDRLVFYFNANNFNNLNEADMILIIANKLLHLYSSFIDINLYKKRCEFSSKIVNILNLNEKEEKIIKQSFFINEDNKKFEKFFISYYNSIFNIKFPLNFNNELYFFSIFLNEHNIKFKIINEKNKSKNPESEFILESFTNLDNEKIKNIILTELDLKLLNIFNFDDFIRLINISNILKY